MPDYLLTFFSTTASLSAVLAFALVFDIRADAQKWETQHQPRGFRITQAVIHIITGVSIFVVFNISMGQLLDNANDRGMAILTSALLGVGFGFLAFGVIFGNAALGFQKDHSPRDTA